MNGTAFNRRSALGLLAGTAAAVSLPPAAWSTVKLSRPLLATPDQIAGERLLLRLIQDPDVRQAQLGIRGEIVQGTIGRTKAGAATIDRAISQWTNSLIFHELGLHRRKPTFLWATDDTPRTWLGHTLGGVGSAGDNPDNIYRTAVIDGSKNYELLGWKDRLNPATQLVIQVDKANLVNPATMMDMKSKMPSVVSATLALLSDPDLRVAADGSFRITMGSGERGPVHVDLKPGELSIGVRDLLGDWRQRPSRLIVRELGSTAPIEPTTAEPLDYAALRAHLIQDLPGYIRFWAKFPEIWFGGLKPNTISAPRGRNGGWGFVAGMNFALAPDEVGIVTTTRGAAAYTGFQINDPWMIQADAKRHQVCLNSSQAKSSADGTFTYVISRRDPGVVNWLDTTGIDNGMGILRWQAVPSTMTGKGLILGFHVAKFTDVADAANLPRITPTQRESEIAARAAAYAYRTK